MRVLSNVLTVELTVAEADAVKATIHLLNELYEAIPDDSPSEDDINDVLNFLNKLRNNYLSDLDVHFSWSNK